jgi:hypothetical protein
MRVTNCMELSTTREANSLMPLDSFPAFYGTRRFNTEFIRALHLFLSWARQMKSTSPHTTPPRFILILSTHLRLGLLNGLFPSGFPTYTRSYSPPFVLHALPKRHAWDTKSKYLVLYGLHHTLSLLSTTGSVNSLRHMRWYLLLEGWFISSSSA